MNRPQKLPWCPEDEASFQDFTNRVDHSSVVLAVWSGAEGGAARTVRYALEKGRELIVVNPNLFRLTPNDEAKRQELIHPYRRI